MQCLLLETVGRLGNRTVPCRYTKHIQRAFQMLISVLQDYCDAFNDHHYYDQQRLRKEMDAVRIKYVPRAFRYLTHSLYHPSTLRNTSVENTLTQSLSCLAAAAVS